MKKPNFFLVGAPKCGTTSMYYYLLQHPDIFMPHAPEISEFLKDPLAFDMRKLHSVVLLKEPHYFGSDLHFAKGHRAACMVTDYLDLFKDALKEKRIGEASVFYLCSLKAAEEINEFDDHALIIIMLRNPVDVMFRMYGQGCFTGTETLSDFEAALKAERSRIENPELLPGTPDLRESLYYKHCATFSEQVERYFDVFGKEQVRVILFDDFKRDPNAVYRDTLSFLGVDKEFVPKVLRANPMSEVRNVRLQKTITHPSPPVRLFARALFPRPVRSWLVRRALRANVKFGTRPQLTQDVRRRIQSEMAEEIGRLGELIGRDLTHWLN